MPALILKAVARLVLVLFVVSAASFVLLAQAPVDAAIIQVGLNATPEAIEEARDELGLNDPIVTRYFRWVGDALQGDLGESYNTPDVTAASMVRNALPKTLELMVLSQLIALGIAIPAAIAAARKPGGLVDRVTSATAFGFLAIPAFVLGIYFVFFFAVRLQWLPAIASDLPSLFDDPIENLRQMALPSLTLGINLVAVYLRLLRTDLIDTLQQDYILLAQARGMSDRRVLWRHALRPSSLSLITAAGLSTGGLIGGALIIELLFAIPGMGRLIVTAVFGADYSIVLAALLPLAIGYVLVNFLVDLIYTFVDPRIRHEAR